MIYPAAKVVLLDPSQPGKLLLIYREVNGSGRYEAAGGRLLGYKRKYMQLLRSFSRRDNWWQD